ncbi:MAG: hypothetical protein FJZ96_06890, partial [Chloroflexi bacterium]|nr:hypothetical protein [Chloroflexota bacterium]
MKHKLIFWISLLVLLAGLGAAAYSYSGPNRTVTTTYTTDERRACYWEAHHPDLPYGPTCYLQLYYAPGSSCPHLDPAYNQGYFNATDCRQAWHGTYGCPASGGRLCSISGPDTWIEECNPGQPGCTSVPHTSTTTLPPATISGSATCGQPGNNGWCLDAASLNLSATEPLSGYVITGIESNLGMLCSTNGAAVSCSWAFPEGNTSLSFWALSSYGDTSLQASASLGLDSTPPSLAVMPSGGAPGNNGWYVAGPLLVSAGASDTTSGLAGTWGRLDGGEWQAGASLQIAEDGVHTVEFRAEDLAGNASSQMTSVRLDTQSPVVAVSLDGLVGAGEWYVSSPEFSVQATDATSGLGMVEISLDGGDWQSTDTLQIPDG